MFLIILLAGLMLAAALTSGQAMALTAAGAISTAIAWAVNHGVFPKSWNITDEKGHLHGRPALILAFAISILVSVACLWITGDSDLHALVAGGEYNLSKMYTVGWAVFGIATMVFKVIFPEKDKKPENTESSDEGDW